MPKPQFDSLLRFTADGADASIGSSYTGVWDDEAILRITLLDVTGAGLPSRTRVGKLVAAARSGCCQPHLVLVNGHTVDKGVSWCASVLGAAAAAAAAVDVQYRGKAPGHCELVVDTNACLASIWGCHYRG